MADKEKTNIVFADGNQVQVKAGIAVVQTTLQAGMGAFAEFEAANGRRVLVRPETVAYVIEN